MLYPMNKIEQLKEEFEQLMASSRETAEQIQQASGSVGNIYGTRLLTNEGRRAMRAGNAKAQVSPLIAKAKEQHKQRQELAERFERTYKETITEKKPLSDADKTIFNRKLTMLDVDIDRLDDRSVQERLRGLIELAAGHDELLSQLSGIVGKATSKAKSTEALVVAKSIRRDYEEAFNASAADPELANLRQQFQTLASDQVLDGASALALGSAFGIHDKATRQLAKHPDLLDDFNRFEAEHVLDYEKWKQNKEVKTPEGKRFMAHHRMFEAGQMTAEEYRRANEKLTKSNENSEVN